MNQPISYQFETIDYNIINIFYVKRMRKLVHTCISKFLSMIDSLHFRQTIILTFPTIFFELTLLIMTFHQDLMLVFKLNRIKIYSRFRRKFYAGQGRLYGHGRLKRLCKRLQCAISVFGINSEDYQCQN